MIGISKEQILMMHYALIEETGGSHGVRDEGLLDSAIAAPYDILFVSWLCYTTIKDAFYTTE